MFHPPNVVRALGVLDSEIETLVHRVYAGEGFTSPELSTAGRTFYVYQKEL